MPENSFKDLEFFKAQGEMGNTLVKVNPKNRGIADVVIWLRPNENDLDALFPPERIHPSFLQSEPVDRVIEAGRTGFSPRATAARVGDRLVYRNPTPIPFNVNYQHENPRTSDRTGCFNVLLPSAGTYRTEPLFTQHKNPDSFSDNIHPWARGFVKVFEHAYFAVTDEDGSFRIEDAPTGSLRIVVWHEQLGYLGGAAGKFGGIITIDPQVNGVQKLGPFVLK
jgi:hypothetical protein